MNERAIMKIYTKTGDLGETSLFDGSRTTKNDLRMEFMGDVDELCAHLGLVLSLAKDAKIEQHILHIIHDLFQINAQIAGAAKFSNLDLTMSVTELENMIDDMDGELVPLTNFIYPVGNQVIGEIHISRAICRRTERKLVAVQLQYGMAANTLVYVNRLSDWLFTLARYFAYKNNLVEIAMVF